MTNMMITIMALSCAANQGVCPKESKEHTIRRDSVTNLVEFQYNYPDDATKAKPRLKPRKGCVITTSTESFRYKSSCKSLKKKLEM